MRAQNRLIAFVARYVSVTTSTTSRFGLSAEADADPARRRPLRARPVEAPAERRDAGTRSTQHARVQLPEIEIAGPDVDLSAAQEYGEGGVLSALTNADQQLDQANRAAAVADLRKQATAEVPMRLARQAARAGGRAQLRDAAGRRPASRT